MKLSKLSRNAKPLRNLCVLFVLMLSVGFVIFIFGKTVDGSRTFLKSSSNKILTTNENTSSSSTIMFWDDSMNIETKIPVDVVSGAEKLVIAERTVFVDGLNIFYRESSQSVASEVTLLLLHGMSFSSKTWLDLATISLFTSAGFRTVAVDLPGFGNSDKLPATIENDKSQFLLKLIKTLKISKPVIVSPSYSGHYTLPLLVKNWESFTGFIPVAPVGQNVIETLKSCHHQGTNDNHNIIRERFNRLPDYFKEQLKVSLPDVSCIKTPTLVIHGEFDRSKSSALLSLLPNARTFEIPKGKHPCYLQNPELFHTVIYNFLLKLVEVESR